MGIGAHSSPGRFLGESLSCGVWPAGHLFLTGVTSIPTGHFLPGRLILGSPSGDKETDKVWSRSQIEGRETNGTTGDFA